MDLTAPAVAVTGHRKFHSAADDAWVEEELHRVAAKLVAEHGMTAGISGMALGADLAWARATLAAGAELHAHIPFVEQPDRWPEAQRAEWKRLRKLARREVIVGELDGTRNRYVHLLHARNDTMLNACDLLVAVVYRADTERKGGSWSAVAKERRWNGRRRPMLLTDPGTRTTRVVAPGVAV